MNIIDTVGYIYITDLEPSSQLATSFGSKINYSFLVHELGHAWAAQKEEYTQDENKNFSCRIGTCLRKRKVDGNTVIPEGTYRIICRRSFK